LAQRAAKNPFDRLVDSESELSRRFEQALKAAGPDLYDNAAALALLAADAVNLASATSFAPCADTGAGYAGWQLGERRGNAARTTSQDRLLNTSPPDGRCVEMADWMGNQRCGQNTTLQRNKALAGLVQLVRHSLLEIVAGSIEPPPKQSRS